MFRKLELTGIKVDLDDNLKKYVNHKIGKLDKYLPKQFRDNAHIEVRLKEVKNNLNNNCVCEVTVNLPKEKIVITEATLNLYAAIDIVEEKLKHKFLKYKQLHSSSRFYRHLASRFKKNNITN